MDLPGVRVGGQEDLPALPPLLEQGLHLLHDKEQEQAVQHTILQEKRRQELLQRIQEQEQQARMEEQEQVVLTVFGIEGQQATLIDLNLNPTPAFPSEDVKGEQEGEQAPEQQQELEPAHNEVEEVSSKLKPPRRTSKRKVAGRKRVNEFIDVNLSGKPYGWKDLEIAPFVAGFLQEVG